MKKQVFLLTVILLITTINAYSSFDDYFLQKTMRLDYFHTGNFENEYYSIDEVIEEPYWGGSQNNLTDIFDYGKFKFEIYDINSNTLIYSRGYSTLFAEWRTTAEAHETWRTFTETIVFPYPKNKILVKFYSRNDKNIWINKYEYTIDPANYFIRKNQRHKAETFNIHESGPASKKLDIVIIPDGYTKDEMGKFHKDCKRFSQYLLKASPFKENKNLINIRGVEAYSEESGPDVPGESIWKSTAVSTTFYMFDTERYLMTFDNKTVRDYASNTWYDQIYILVNTSTYGGGSIYNYYSVCVSNNDMADYVFIHEFGHGFAGLGDEYYTSEVSVQDFYPLDVEPWEPNITTLVNFESKWKNFLASDTPVPTPDTKQYQDKVGVFEGAAYSSKGIYRPVQDCTMKSISYDNFCPVCKDAIIRMLKFYSD